MPTTTPAASTKSVFPTFGWFLVFALLRV